MPADNLSHPVLLFDGVCNLCDQSVQFIIKQDKQAQFRFASLQSELAKNLLKKYQLTDNQLSTVVLITDGKAFTKSTAALITLKKLGGWWSILYSFIIIPRPIRNAIYEWIARNRYRWFGKKDQCMIPTPELKGRFLD